MLKDQTASKFNLHNGTAKNLNSTFADQSEVKFFENYLEKTGHIYAKNLKPGNFSVQLMGLSVRPASRLYRFCLVTNGWQSAIRIKVPLIRQGIFAGAQDLGSKPVIERPRLAPVTPPEIKSELEYKALSAIYAYVTDLNDPRFAAIRVHDYIQEFHAIVMEEIALPNLSQLFFRASRLHFTSSPDNLNEAFRNAGAWLRMFHQLPNKEQANARHTGRSDFVESVAEFTKFLRAHLGDDEYFNNVARVIKTTALRILPESLPLGLAHGDFAMRNMLVGSNNEVTIVDTLARWRSPIFEDIAYLLIGLKGAGLLVFTQGLAFSRNRIQRYEHEFLSGYFHEEIVQYSIIRLFEAQALLDVWSARITDLKLSDRRSVSRKQSYKLYFFNHYFRKLLNQLISGVR